MISSNRVGLLILVAVLAACSSTATDAGPAVVSPEGSWTVTLIGSVLVQTDQPPTLTFDADGSVHGHTGVNMARGRWTLDELGLHVHGMVSTRMAGPPDLMDQERRLLTTLERVRGVRDELGARLLLDGNGGVLIRMEPAAPGS